MRETLTVTLRNAVDAIPAASDSADAWLEAHRGSPAARLLVALAIEELVTNCIKYGYDDDREHTIGLELVVTGGVRSTMGGRSIRWRRRALTCRRRWTTGRWAGSACTCCRNWPID